MSDQQPLPAHPATSSIRQPSQRSTLGLVSLIIAIVGLVLGLGTSLTVQVMYHDRMLLQLGALISVIEAITALVLYAAALVIGIIALRGSGPKIAAGIGTGIAIAGLVGVVTALGIALMAQVIPYS